MISLQHHEDLKSLYFKLCDKNNLGMSDDDLIEKKFSDHEKNLAFRLIKLAREIHQIKYPDYYADDANSIGDDEILKIT